MPKREVEEGKHIGVEGKRQTCPRSFRGLQQSARSSGDEPLSLDCRPPPKICWISPPVSVPCSRFEEINSQPPAVTLSNLQWHQPSSKPRHGCRVTVTLLTQCDRQRRMLQSWAGIGRTHTPTHMCEFCQRVCELCQSSVLGLRTKFVCFLFELFITVWFIFCWTQPCSNPGFTNDLNLDLEGLYFDRNHWRTYFFVLSL